MISNGNSWWQEAVFYHIYLRSFSDSDGDGLGDLPGLINRLDHLKGQPSSLGVDAIWLSPFYPSPDKDFGYDVADYCAVDPRYGSMEDFDRLIEEAHQRGIRILIDLVFNHSSDQHAWFQESSSSRESSKHDWYIWRDARSENRPPNNWASIFGGKAWEWNKQRQQFYYHMFLPEQPDLNWRNAEVQEAMMNVVRFWLERGVDGFRLDVFNLWFKHEDMPDNPKKLGLRGYERQNHLYDIDQPEMHPALQRFRRILDDYGERTSVGEFLGPDLETAASYCHDKELHMAFNFNFTWCPWKPSAFHQAILKWEAALSDEGWPCYVLSNHDGPRRHISRYGGRHPDKIGKVAASMLLTLRGTPFLYYGEEIGMPDMPLKRSQLKDPISRKYWPIHSRDQGRAPMQWDDTINAGFSYGNPWLPVHPEYRGRNVAGQINAPHSMLSFYRNLIRLRRRTPALQLGSYLPLQRKAKDGLLYLRHHSSGDALIGLNFKSKPIRMRFDREPTSASWTLAMSSDPNSNAKISNGELELSPFEAVIFLSS